MLPIPIIDLFAGPGGLGEGFSRYRKSGLESFDIKLSVEMDEMAHSTLQLRAIYRELRRSGDSLDPYWEYVRETDSRRQAGLRQFLLSTPAGQKGVAEAPMPLKLGRDNREIDRLITTRIKADEHWVLLGGPPCQAYSVVGRSRMYSGKPKEFEKDPRLGLYKEYRRIIGLHQPAIFVMENVGGMLSTRIDGKLVVEDIFAGLCDPVASLPRSSRMKVSKVRYKIRSFIDPDTEISASEASSALIHCERFGIPQRRRRVLLLGIREDIDIGTGFCLAESSRKKIPTVADAISDLPRIRSQVSKVAGRTLKINGDFDLWCRSIEARNVRLLKQKRFGSSRVATVMDDKLGQLRQRAVKLGFGGQAIRRGNKKGSKWLQDHEDWFRRGHTPFVLNHEYRKHMDSDLARYFFISCFGVTSQEDAKNGHRSPKLTDFPKALLPKHKNVDEGKFVDRFRVQIRNQPATTVLSHISKDGHYYVHYDPLQCRSLTVREAARIQTFPDDYFFEGRSTAAYHQVGNAVPPMLAVQLAEVVYEILTRRA